MKRLALIITSLFFPSFLLAQAPVQGAQEANLKMLCGNTVIVFDIIKEEYNETPLLYLKRKDAVITLWSNSKTMSSTLTATYKDGTTCLMADGTMVFEKAGDI